MADYDIGVIGLQSPPSAAVLTQYRPAVLVRNNGIHDAIASGYLRVYAAGLLIFESEVYSNTLGPGESGPAQAVAYWTPPAEGTYIIQGYVSTPLDQVEPNNNLTPVTIQVTGEPPPPPTPVEPHAPQHEEGGADEISIDGLPGRAADPQDSLPHAAKHQAGGEDQLNVGSLQGVLAQDQPAQVHSNARHSPTMATTSELSSHQNAGVAHSSASNLANRDLSGPEAGLVPWLQLATGSAVPAGPDNGLRSDRLFGPVKSTNLGANASAGSILPGPGYTTVHFVDSLDAWMHDHMALEIAGFGQLLLDNLGSLSLRLMYEAASWCTITIPGTSDLERHFFFRALITGLPVDSMTGMIEWIDDGQSTHVITRRMNIKPALVARPITGRTWSITAELTSGSPGSSLVLYSRFSRSLRPQP